MKISWILWLLLVIGLVGGSLSAAEVYTWKDADGMVHITDRIPPANVQLESVVKEKRPIVEKLAPERDSNTAGAAAREQIRENQAAWRSVQELRDQLDAAQAAYEDAAAALQAEQAKYTYSARRRQAPRRSVTELEEAAKAAFAEYRRILDAYNAAELAAREADERARSAIEAVGAKPPDAPDAQPLDAPGR